MTAEPVAEREAPAQRLAVLDGLRGWASVSVVFFHLTWEMFGQVLPPFRSLPVAIVGDGSLAVGLFLMVSGYVLTARGWRNPDKHPIRRALLKRYFRLTIPVAAAVMLYWAVMALGLAVNLPAAALVRSSDWLGTFARVSPNALDALMFGLFGVYGPATAGGYGPFLWTMAIELWGSYIILGICLFELPRWMAYLPLALVTLGALLAPVNIYFPLAACYPVGAIVALLAKDGVVGTRTPGRWGSLVATMLLLLFLVAAAIAQIVRPPYWVTPLLAMGIFVAALRSRPATMFLSMPLSHWLGRISFPLYLVQIVVIVSLTSELIILADQTVGLNVPVATGIIVLSFAVSLLLAWLFMPVERLALRLSGSIATVLAPTRCELGLWRSNTPCKHR